MSYTTMPPLWFVGFGVTAPVPVRDLDDALRVAERALGFGAARGMAGRGWWLVPTWTAASAEREARFLGQGRHNRQADFAVAHQAIRVGLDPDLSPLYDLSPLDHQRRDYPLFVTPI